MIGQEYKRLAAVGILESDSSQILGVMTVTEETIQENSLIANNSGGSIDRSRIEASGVEIRFGSGNKEAAGLVQSMETGEVQVTSIHDVERTRLWDQNVENIDVVPFAIGNMDEAWDCTFDI